MNNPQVLQKKQSSETDEKITKNHILSFPLNFTFFLAAGKDLFIKKGGLFFRPPEDLFSFYFNIE